MEADTKALKTEISLDLAIRIQQVMNGVIIWLNKDAPFSHTQSRVREVRNAVEQLRAELHKELRQNVENKNKVTAESKGQD